MKHMAACLIAVLAIAGCAQIQPVPSGVAFQCAPQCYMPCKPLSDWSGRTDPDYITWLIVKQYVPEHEQCNQQRAICAACLEQLKQTGVIH